MESQEKIPTIETKQETMKIPKIEVRKEKGPILLSFLLKEYDPQWSRLKKEEPGNKVLRTTADFFKENPLNEQTESFLNNIKALKEDEGVDQETLYNMALTYNNPERIDHLFDFLEKNKDDVKNAREIREKLIEELDKLDKTLPDPIKNEIEGATLKDIEARKENIDETKKQISGLIDFFKPRSETTEINKIIIAPTDPFLSENSASSYQFGNEMILRSNIENPKGLEHEFLHSVINPIIEKLSNKLTEEQKKEIVKMGSYDLRVQQNYGNDHFILLCEEFIRTYNELIQEAKDPFENFQEKINSIDEEMFSEILNKKEDLKNNFEELNISTLEDLKKRGLEFYERFEKNELREVIFLFYQKFIHEREENEETHFEDFVLNNFPKEI